MSLNHSLLYYFVKDALRLYSEEFSILDRTNPSIFSLNKQTFSIHVSYVHDSGNTRSNEDEVRIQINRKLIEKQKSQFNKGIRVAFIGFFGSGDIFIAWDPQHIFSLQAKTIVSVYARESLNKEAQKHQIAAYSFKANLLKKRSFAIAMPASSLGFYLENIERFHNLPTQESIRQVVRNNINFSNDNEMGKNGNFTVSIGKGKREKFTYSRKSYPRDPRFKDAVLKAYSQTCCICNRQLGLVQAAHIIPHSEPDSQEIVQNGLAICVEHHRLYDDALLLPGPGHKLVFNESRADYLRSTGREKGLFEISAKDGQRYTIPKIEKLQPSDKFLQRGLEIRLGK